MREGGERHVKVPASLGKGGTPTRPISGLNGDDDFFLCEHGGRWILCLEVEIFVCRSQSGESFRRPRDKR